MTVDEWSRENKFYEESEMYDADGNLVWLFEDNDPKYQSKVLRVKPKDPEYPWICAEIYTDWKEMKE